MTAEDDVALTRRMAVAGLAAGGASLAATAALGQTFAAPAPADVGAVRDGRVRFPAWQAETERPEGDPPAPLPREGRVGFAVVGLGKLTLEQILPAFAQTSNARVVALVSGSPEKARVVAAQYGVEPSRVFDYAGFDRIADDPTIQAVYVVLPNGMHHAFTLRAARAGKHVLCEKPMATSSAECREMVAACDAAKVSLMVAYRCQYEPYNRDAIAIARSGAHGPIRLVEATNHQTMGTADQWRFHKALAGGGALPDIGLYCLNGARAVTGEEPSSVTAGVYSPPGDARWREVEETVHFTLAFPSGAIAICNASYGMHDTKTLRVHGPAGWIDLENAFAYAGQRSLAHSRDGAAERVADRRLAARNQFALEIEHMATCVARGLRPRTPGEEGVADHVVMEAIYRAAETGGRVALPVVAGRDVTRGPALDPG